MEDNFKKLSYYNVRWISPSVAVLRNFKISNGIVLDVGYKYASFSFVVKGKEIRTSYIRILAENALFLRQSEYRLRPEDKTSKEYIKWKLTTGWNRLLKDKIFDDNVRNEVNEEYKSVERQNWEKEF